MGEKGLSICVYWIFQATGSPPSAFQIPYESFNAQLDSENLSLSRGTLAFPAYRNENIIGDLDYEFICFFLSSQRIDLYRHIDLRCEEMLIGAINSSIV